EDGEPGHLVELVGREGREVVLHQHLALREAGDLQGIALGRAFLLPSLERQRRLLLGRWGDGSGQRVALLPPRRGCDRRQALEPPGPPQPATARTPRSSDRRWGSPRPGSPGPRRGRASPRPGRRCPRPPGPAPPS